MHTLAETLIHAKRLCFCFITQRNPKSGSKPAGLITITASKREIEFALNRGVSYTPPLIQPSRGGGDCVAGYIMHTSDKAF